MSSKLSIHPVRIAELLCCISTFALFAACDKKEPPKPAQPAEVTFVTTAPAAIEDNLEFVGQVQAFRTVQVRAQATGLILSRSFTEGTAVKTGDTLFRIDPVTAEADVRSARARLAEAEARLSISQTNAARLRPLLVGNAVAKLEVDNAESQATQARAVVDEARGSLDAAQKRLSETVVRAEISGRIGRALLDLGARVAGVSDLLTTIDVVDPVYVSFRPSADQQFRWRTDPVARKNLDQGGTARVAIAFPDGSTYPRVGKIGYIDPVVDAGTGTQQYRAEFQNPDRLLVPGQFVQVHILGLRRDSALLVPQRAVLQQMGQQVVYVIGEDNKASARVVKATSWSGNNWLIEKGLKAGERVVVDGVQKVNVGAVVKPKPLADSEVKSTKPDSAKSSESDSKKRDSSKPNSAKSAESDSARRGSAKPASAKRGA